MARSYSTEAIIIKSVNFGESDRIITFLSPYRGKFRAVAKGVRKIASRRSPNLDLFNLVKAQFVSGKNIDLVTEVEAIETFKKVKEDLERVSYGFYLSELTNEFLADGQGNIKIFNLLKNTLLTINNEMKIEKVKIYLFAFIIKFLEIVGYRPELYKCSRCNQIIKPTTSYLSPDLGGLVHYSCAKNLVNVRPASYDLVKILRFLQRENWSGIKRLKLSGSLCEKIDGNLRFYTEYLLEKEIKSAKFIDQMKK